MVAVALVGGLVGAGAIGAVGNAVGGQEAAKGAEKAAQTQATAETTAVNEQTQAQQQAVNQEIAQGNSAAALQQPYEQLGSGASSMLLADLQPGGPLAQVPSLTGPDITQMPGYEFTLQQGLLSTQNAAAAQGLGVSGTALGAASNYATGLAAENYQNYFNDFWANQNNRYNMLYNATQLGANSSTNAGNQMIDVGGQVGNTLTTSAGNIANTETTSAANIGSAQATAGADIGQGISGATSALGTGISNALLANALLGQTQGGSTVGTGGANSLYPNGMNQAQFNAYVNT